MNVNYRLLGPNFFRIDIDNVVLWFSYETCIAFAVKGHTVVSVNVWSKTTGKHLNQIDDDKSNRIPYDAFCAMLDAVRIGE